jgi:hypothetical protein
MEVLKVREVPAQIVEPGFAVIEIDGTTEGVTVIVTGLDVTDDGSGHCALLVSLQVTCWPFVKPLVVYVLPVAPDCSVPFIYHWYEGLLPPLVMEELNVADVPLHIVVPGLAEIDIVGVTVGIVVVT